MTEASPSIRFNYLKVEIEEHGTYYVPAEVAACAAKMLSAAHEIASTVDSIGIVVPIHLIGTGPKPISAIKFVRQLTHKNLKDSKAIVDQVRGLRCQPKKYLLGHYPWNDALRIQNDAAEIGVRVELPNPLTLLAREAE